jgi:16S rRNA (guanine527-N7)-methyltransferase
VDQDESITPAAVSPDSLPAALARHGIELAPEAVEQLDRYCRLLWEWNERLNLTRHTDYERFVARDVIDAMQLERLLDAGHRVLDVGTGGGLPGLVIAAVRPDVEMVLCESIAKKAKAVAEIVRELGVPVPVVHGRAETLLESQAFDSLVVRAVAPLAKLLTWFRPHWDAIGQILVVKGPAWIDERAAARERRLLSGLTLRKVATYNIPGTDAESVVLRITRPES